MSIEKVLEERKKTHGDFTNHASLSQALKYTMSQAGGYEHLSPDKREALEMIMHKVARILNGNPEVKDHWTDIIGYATLVEKTLNEPFKLEVKETKFNMLQFAYHIYSFMDSNSDFIRSQGLEAVLSQACERFVSNGCKPSLASIINKGLSTEVKL